MSPPVFVVLPLSLMPARRTRRHAGWFRRNVVTRAFIRILSLLVFCVLLTIGSTYAQRSIPSDATPGAEHEFLRTYERCLTTLSPENQKGLQEAEQAWIVFADKNEAAIPANAAVESKKRLIRWQKDQRIAHLDYFFLRFRYAFEDNAKTLAETDAQLSPVYASCLARLSPEEQSRLREAQRAWIIYRNLDADAAVLAARQANRPLFRGYSAKAGLTALRTAELRAMYLTEDSRPSVEPLPTPPTPRNDDAALLVPLVADAKPCLQKIIHAKDASFFAEPDSMSKALPLNEEASAKVAEINTKATELLRKTYSVQNLPPEISTLQILSNWNQFTSRLKSGDPEDATPALPTEKTPRPKAIPAEYAPIWDSIERWERFYLARLTAYRQHVKRAESLADLGKASEAIREYNAAFALFENPRISKAVKRLREQSLGL